MTGNTVFSKWGVIPSCTKGHNHRWKDSNKVFGESGICSKCGYDAFDKLYREVSQ